MLAAGMALPEAVCAAASSFSLSVTPPLIRLNLAPGDVWKSELKIMNINPIDEQFYASVLDFGPKGESGGLEFIKKDEAAGENGSHLLSKWIEVSSEPFLVKSGESYGVPFTISVPKNAEPGGHYAAILIGRSPAASKVSGAQIEVASMVSSLVLLRVGGEIVESGLIREFSAAKRIFGRPQVDFKLVFENLGNVHLRPTGSIVIKNIFGSRVAELPINEESSEYGNVLPQSSREWQKRWEDDGFHLGLFSAEALLSFGEGARSSATAKTYFIVAPVKPLAVILLAFGLLVALIIFIVRRYVNSTIKKIAELRGAVSRGGGDLFGSRLIPEYDAIPDKAETDSLKSSDGLFSAAENTYLPAAPPEDKLARLRQSFDAFKKRREAG